VKKVITGSSDISESVTEVEGKLASNPDDIRLMRSVIESDKEYVDQGKLINESLNQGLSSFTPSALFEHLVNDYKNAERIYGEAIIRESTGKSTGYVERNIKIPEYRKELKKRLEQQEEDMRKKDLINKDGYLTDKAIKLAVLDAWRPHWYIYRRRGWRICIYVQYCIGISP